MAVAGTLVGCGRRWVSAGDLRASERRRNRVSEVKHLVLILCLASLAISACDQSQRALRQAIAQQEQCWEDNGGEVNYAMIVDERSISVDEYVAIKERHYAASCHVQEGFVVPRMRTDPSWEHWFSDLQLEELALKGLLPDSEVAAAFVAQTPTTSIDPGTTTTVVAGDSFVAYLGDRYGIPYDENTTLAEMLRALPTPTPKYQADQYGCHSDGRCLGEDDQWCDEGDFGYPYGDFNREPVCYPWEYETVDR